VVYFEGMAGNSSNMHFIHTCIGHADTSSLWVCRGRRKWSGKFTAGGSGVPESTQHSVCRLGYPAVCPKRRSPRPRAEPPNVFDAVHIRHVQPPEQATDAKGGKRGGQCQGPAMPRLVIGVVTYHQHAWNGFGRGAEHRGERGLFFFEQAHTKLHAMCWLPFSFPPASCTPYVRVRVCGQVWVRLGVN
jgi:hypothetical protein